MTIDDKQEIQISPLYNVILELEPKIRGVAYNYTAPEDFLKIDSIEEMQLVYWSEIIQRMHVCAATSIKRVKKWFDAVSNAYDAENYYGFCAALRGLVEACADTFYTTSKIIEPICANFSAVEIALNGHAKKVIFAEQIENELIHYVFARKLAKSEKDQVPNDHEAKHVRTYLYAIKDQEVLDLYAELCQVSHPSNTSLLPFLHFTDDHSLIFHQEQVDKLLNDNLLKRHKKAILSASQMAVLPAICILKLINEFHAPIVDALKTQEQPLKPAVESELWRKFANIIQASRNGQQKNTADAESARLI